MQNGWGTLYLIRPHMIVDDPADAVVEAYEGGRKRFSIAIELLDLVDRARAQTARALLERAHERKPALLDDSAIANLLELTAGIEAMLRDQLLDAQWYVDDARLPELRSRPGLVKVLDLEETRGVLARAAVGEGLAGVLSLRNILRRAQADGLHIVLD
ncbi:MAG: hypothetical protein HOV81_01750 [Kofleriaceae bacterium]|nr:hypothetical protein [Kofleriaceae bacterium]